MKEKKNSSRIAKKGLLVKIGIGFLLSSILIIIVFLSNLDFQQEKKEYLHPVKLIKAEKGSLRKQFRISGFIESEKLVHILPQVSGQITEIYVDSGQKIKKDQVLAKINSETYALQLKQAKAAYMTHLSTWHRISRLWQNQNTTKQNYEEVKAGYEAALSRYELAKLQYEYTQIRAPINATVLEKHISIGSLVSPEAGTPIVSLADLDQLIIKAKIPEKYYGFFQQNSQKMPVIVKIPSLEGKEFQAAINRISPYIKAETRNFEVICSLSRQNEQIKPGMYVHLSFIMEERENIYHLPLKVLINQSRFWLLKEQGPPYFAKAIDFNPVFFTEKDFQIPEKWKEKYFLLEGQYFIKEEMELKIINPEILSSKKELEQGLNVINSKDNQ